MDKENLSLRKKIWILDDDLSILNVIEIILKDAGYEVQTFSDTKNFTKKIYKEIPDLILLDTWMVGEDGRYVAKKLKNKPLTKNIPIIMFSALSDIAEIAKEAKVEDYLPKPFDMQDLLRIIEKYINR